MSVARFIADQRTFYRVPHTITCTLLGVSLSWFYKWLDRTPTPTEQRRSKVDAAVAEAFAKARGLHGSPRLHADLRGAGWAVSAKTVADSMRRQGLVARRIRRRNGLTRQDKTAPKFPTCLMLMPHRTAGHGIAGDMFVDSAINRSAVTSPPPTRLTEDIAS